jgi:hypothetical protein
MGVDTTLTDTVLAPAELAEHVLGKPLEEDNPLHEAVYESI